MARRVVFILAISACLGRSASAQVQPQLPAVDISIEVLGDTLSGFTSRMDAYATLRQSLQAGLPELQVTDKPNVIHETAQLLAARIRQARAGARRGDIFTEDTRRGFRQLLRPLASEGACAAIRDDNPGEFSYDVNDAYPKDKPLSTVPASMLAVLPRLPDDVSYRFLRRDLILHDSRANIILDRIDDAVRCPDQAQ